MIALASSRILELSATVMEELPTIREPTDVSPSEGEDTSSLCVRMRVEPTLTGTDNRRQYIVDSVHHFDGR